MQDGINVNMGIYHPPLLLFLLIYVTSTPAIFFNFQVKRDGRESNRATNVSLPPRLKMTDIKQNQQTTEKSKVYIILPPPPPPGKNIACWGKVENIIFLQTRKNNTTPTLKKKLPPLKKTSPVQSPVQI